MSSREKFTSYIDEDGFVQNKQWPQPFNESGNGFVYSAGRVCILRKSGEWTHTDVADFETLCKNSQIKPGLYKRSPTHKDQQGPDDICAIASAASEHDDLRYLAKELLVYGLFPHPIPFNYNNVIPNTIFGINNDTGKRKINWSAMFFRQPQLIAHFMYAWNKWKPPFFLRWVWNLTIKTNGFKGDTEDQDSWVLSWHLINAYRNSKFRTDKQDQLVHEWYERFYKQWPGGMKELLTRYFGFSHPLALEWKM